jgi:hypothetical protein
MQVSIEGLFIPAINDRAFHPSNSPRRGKNFKLTCKWTDSSNKTAVVDWTYRGEDRQDVELGGDASSDAAPFAKDFYEAVAKEVGQFN